LNDGGFYRRFIDSGRIKYWNAQDFVCYVQIVARTIVAFTSGRRARAQIGSIQLFQIVTAVACRVPDMVGCVVAPAVRMPANRAGSDVKLATRLKELPSCLALVQYL